MISKVRWWWSVVVVVLMVVMVGKIATDQEI
jgi:hypothetical protein